MLREESRAIQYRYLVPVVVVLGGLLRALRLSWQPLWWDEGYSVYFATEPLGRMVHLTAQDIHPPLYYVLLHGWLVLWGHAQPVALRSLSVLIGTLSIVVCWWMVRTLLPRRPGIAVFTSLVVAAHPMHLFYSQEVRMYGLVLLLGLLSTAFFWRMVAESEPVGTVQESYGWQDSVAYICVTAALLYTEYYAAFLPLAHFAWGIRVAWPARRKLVHLFGVGALISILYMPWLLYAVPELVPYVTQKIVADGDRPLGPVLYFWRHLVAFIAGHVVAGEPWVFWVQRAAVGLVILAVLAGFGVRIASSKRNELDEQRSLVSSLSPLPLITASLVIPFIIGFGLNLRLPFFPEGGERVLHFVLPYFVLLMVWVLAGSWWQGGVHRVVAGLGGASLLVATASGVIVFFSVERYVDEDYRPIVQHVVQQGTDEDTVFTVFPWQVGYWRAYAPVWGKGALHGPWPVLTPSASWNGEVAVALDQALEKGKLWFPAHLALGGILETEIESYLATSSSGGLPSNFYNQWYNSSTRLSGWSSGQTIEHHTVVADFAGEVVLNSAAVSPVQISAANQVLHITLGWSQRQTPAEELRVSLRLVDERERVWASRDYSPLGAAYLQNTQDGAQPGRVQERVGMVIPPGVPPGSYKVTVGVGPDVEEPWLYPVTAGTETAETVPVGRVDVQSPDEPVPILRLPIQNRLSELRRQSGGTRRDGVTFLGVSGYRTSEPTLAGARLQLSLFMEAQTESLAARHLYVSLLDENGEGVAGWEGWPLEDYPIDLWPAEVAVRVPVDFYLPASLPDQEYGLIVGLLDPETQQKSAPVPLEPVTVVQRAHDFEAPRPETVLVEPVQFGSHARLLGYDAVQDNGALSITLYWEVLQTLLPPHQVFAHLTGPDGEILVQDDSVPGQRATAAPTGTWLPGEYITDPHVLPLRQEIPQGATVRVGLYRPETGVRLPVQAAGAIEGDAAVFDVPLE